jgi:UDP:flavonoid glycosyltransferase YjiC (YdhE family)
MRVLIAASGSRGDFQPLLALALALRKRGHEPLLAATPTFASEAAVFGIPFVGVGRDMQRMLREYRDTLESRNPLALFSSMNDVMRDELQHQLEGYLPLLQGMDLMVAGGAVFSARTAAESAGLPFQYVAYTPQILPSTWHMPAMLPLTRSPRWFNRLSWAGMRWFSNRTLLEELNSRRRQLGLTESVSILDHIFSPEHSLVAADPELYPLPPDLRGVPQVGSFCLEDERPLPADLERFLAEGEPPVYIGFGSMQDSRPERTTRFIAEAVRRAGCRAVLSAGWAGLGAEGLGKELLVVGDVSHWRLFPRLSGIVHHGGAGTTAAAARAGVPQVVVPHILDQFLLAKRVRDANLGVSFSRHQLTVKRLHQALVRIRGDASLRETATQVGERIRQRDALGATVQLLEQAPGLPLPGSASAAAHARMRKA